MTNPLLLSFVATLKTFFFLLLPYLFLRLSSFLYHFPKLFLLSELSNPVHSVFSVRKGLHPAAFCPSVSSSSPDLVCSLIHSFINLLFKNKTLFNVFCHSVGHILALWVLKDSRVMFLRPGAVFFAWVSIQSLSSSFQTRSWMNKTVNPGGHTKMILSGWQVSMRYANKEDAFNSYTFPLVTMQGTTNASLELPTLQHKLQK